MIRPTITSPRHQRKQRQLSLGFGNVFNSIAQTFKSQTRSARQSRLPIVINPTVVGGTSDQQNLFKKVRSSSLEVRSEAIIKLINSLKEFSISSVPEIWYAAKNLIVLTDDRETRRNCLTLLLNCIKHDDLESSAIRLTYYEDLVTFCELDYLGSKIDKDFDLFLSCLEALTNNGHSIHDYCLHEEYPLQHFLSLALLLGFAEGFSKDDDNEQTFVRLVMFTTNCISYNGYLFDQTSLAMLTQQLISLTFKCPSKGTMMALLDFIELLIIHGIPYSVIHYLIELLSYVYSVEQEMTWKRILTLLKDPCYTQRTIMTLTDIISNRVYVLDVSEEDRVSITIGAIDILKNIATDKELSFLGDSIKNFANDIIESLHLATIQLNHATNYHILSFLEALVKQNPLMLDNEHWSGGEYSIIQILYNIASFSRKTEESSDKFKSLLSTITLLALNGEFSGDESKLVEFYMSGSVNLSDSEALYVLDYFESRSYSLPLFESFESVIREVLKMFQVRTNSSKVRLRCAELVTKSLLLSFDDDPNFDTVRMRDYMLGCLFEGLYEANDITILRYLFGEFLIDVLFKLESRESFKSFLDILMRFFVSPQEEQILIQLTKTLCQYFVLISVRHNDEFRAAMLFEVLLEICERAIFAENFQVLLTISKVLIRIRRKSSGQMFFTSPGDIEGLTSAFNRNFTNIEDNSPSLHELSWSYPEEIEYISSEVLDIPSKVSKGNNFFNMSKWLDIVVKIMEEFYDWEIYSYVWSHFCPQLSNLDLFVSKSPSPEQISSISKLRVIICNQLSAGLPPKLVFPTGLGRADLQIAMIRTLTALIAYHGFFSKNEEDMIIKSTVEGVSTSWEKTAIPSIHFLNLCCYEIPLSVKKYLSLILIKLQTRVSSFFASPHILEFLMSLSHLPSLSSNFNLEEFKRIFGISFQFIEFCKISRLKSLDPREEIFLNKHGEDVKVENVPSTELINITPALSQYLLGLSYSVISSWYLKMTLSKRRQLEPFIVRNLILSSRTSENDELDDQTLGFLDFISRFSYSDNELNFKKNLRLVHSGSSETSRWLINNSIMSLTTLKESSEAVLIIRKPSDFNVFNTSIAQLDIQNLLRLSDVQKLFSQNEPLFEFSLHTKDENDIMRKLPATSAITRAIDNLDRLPVLQFCKAGIIYISEGQSTEKAILSNRFGSLQYNNFLLKVGSLISLKDCTNVNVGGLDTENDLDGEFAIFWNDKITQLIFHTTTLMPNNNNDENFSLKKRHVGNNYVNVYFDESGLPFDFNIIKSQFNFINIVISPVSDSYYRVKVYRRNGVPAVFAASHFKLISETRLATFVRNLVLVCHQFSDVWNSEGKFTSNWSRRVQHIKRITLSLTEEDNTATTTT